MKHLLVPATTFDGCAVKFITLTFEKDYLMVHSLSVVDCKIQRSSENKEILWSKQQETVVFSYAGAILFSSQDEWKPASDAAIVFLQPFIKKI